MLLDRLRKEELLNGPKWLPNNTVLLTMMGSEAYGAASNESDIDVYGVCIPPKELIFPHQVGGEIEGFSTQKKRFNVYQQHHIKSSNKKEYDLAIYSIVSYFKLAMDGSPNIIDSLFVPRRCVMHSTLVGEMIIENRKLFLTKKLYHSMKGYSYAQMKKIWDKTNYTNPKRKEDIDKFGYSTKYAMHLIRLLLECEQVLVEHDLNLERNSELLKSIRRGEWTLDHVEKWFENKQILLEDAYHKSTLPHSPDEDKIKEVLLNCIEQHYGSVQNLFKIEPNSTKILDELKSLVEKYEKGN